MLYILIIMYSYANVLNYILFQSSLTNILCMFYVPISISKIPQNEIKLLQLLMRRRKTTPTNNKSVLWDFAIFTLSSLNKTFRKCSICYWNDGLVSQHVSYGNINKYAVVGFLS